ncbi:hypothetical protein HMPREF0880_00367 [Yokenella regensburgei ATCC 43003]|nr:hypothetical protein HMPREF0880_00367 [Yokenella regensburgei ATCC 43003]
MDLKHVARWRCAYRAYSVLPFVGRVRRRHHPAFNITLRR